MKFDLQLGAGTLIAGVGGLFAAEQLSTGNVSLGAISAVLSVLLATALLHRWLNRRRLKQALRSEVAAEVAESQKWLQKAQAEAADEKAWLEESAAADAVTNNSLDYDADTRDTANEHALNVVAMRQASDGTFMEALCEAGLLAEALSPEATRLTREEKQALKKLAEDLG